jgi:signal transduction histidine kinase/ligand-binding sensor domain-containing protein
LRFALEHLSAATRGGDVDVRRRRLADGLRLRRHGLSSFQAQPFAGRLAHRTVRLAPIGSLLIAAMLCARVATAQYQIEQWTTEDGLPQNVVTAVIQARDGYIWLATLDGLARFDGVRFTVFNRSKSPGIRSNRFISLYGAADGAIWAGTDGAGVTRYASGAFTTYTTQDGLPSGNVDGLTGDATGHIWALSGGHIVRWTGRHFRPAALQGVSVRFSRSVGSSQVFWASDRGVLHRFANGALSARPLPTAAQGLSNGLIDEDAAGGLWMGTVDDRIARISGSTVRFDSVRNLDADAPALKTTYRDRTGHEWPLTLTRALARRWTFPETREAIVISNAVLEDREGNIWLGANGQGLYRVRRPRVTVHSRAQGLLGRNIYPVHADRSGNVWLGAWPTGLSRITNGRVVNYTVGDGLGSGLVTSLAEDRQGRLWTAAHYEVNGGLRVFANGRFRDVGRTLVPKQTTIHAMLHDRTGALWLGSSTGLVRYDQDVLTTFTTADGLPANNVKAIIEAQDGRIWVGSDGGLTSWQAGKLQHWTERDGLPAGVVRSLYEDVDGVLWIGTYDSGLARYKDGRFSRFTTREGLYDDGVFQILEDRRGYLWMSSNRGIHRVRKQDLNAVADGTAASLTSLSLGKGDGLLNAECNGGTWPAGAIGPNGTLWFPTQDGVAVIDPETIAVTPRPVPTMIESVLIDRRAVPLDGPLRIVPGQRALEIQYTGLSLVNSERIRFRYRLNGLDREWVDAGTRRTAYYTHLPPGGYTFSVTAAGSDGVWTDAVASVAIRVVPPFWRTWWFLMGAVVASLSAGGFAYHRRVAALEGARAAQETFARQLIASQEQERRRIAAELHDSLGQHLVVIKNRALLGSMTSGNGSKEQFDEISASATQSLDEVKHIAYNLRPYHLDKLGLATSLEALTERIGASSGIEFTVEVPPMHGAVPKDQEINVYRIVQESLNNIVKHSGATQASIDVVYHGRELVITIADTGKGFDAKAAKAPMIGSGFGLTGVAERVGMLGGRHSVVSSPGQGTTVTIVLPRHDPQESE